MIIIKFSHLCYFADFSVIKKHITQNFLFCCYELYMSRWDPTEGRGEDKLKDWDSHIHTTIYKIYN